MIFVDLIKPQTTDVSTVDNQVKIEMRLSSEIPPRALIRVTYPADFIPQRAVSDNTNANSMSSGADIFVGSNIPRGVTKRHVANIIDLEVSSYNIKFN